MTSAENSHNDQEQLLPVKAAPIPLPKEVILELEMTGLMALTCRRYPNDDNCTILFVDARTDQFADSERTQRYFAHTHYIGIPISLIDDRDKDKIHYTDNPENAADKKGIFMVAKEEIKVTFPDPKHQPTKPDPTSLIKDDILNLENIYLWSVPIDNALLNGTANDGVVGRLRLTGGLLGYLPGKTSIDIAEAKYQFFGETPKKYAATLRYQWKFSSDAQVVLKFVDFVDSTKELSIRLNLKLASPNTTITIANEPPLDLLVRFPVGHPSIIEDFDFGLIYKVSSIQGKTPSAIMDAVAPETPRPIICGFARFSDNPIAGS